MSSFEKDYYEAESFWQGEMLQDPANQERIKITTSLIPNDVSSMADIGCGNGVFVNYLKEFKPGLKTIGVDRSKTALAYVKTEKVESDIIDLPFDDKSFDCVSCLEVIEHLPVPVYHKALTELSRIASKYIILSVPFDERLEKSYNRCPSCRTIFNYELHVRSFSEDYFKTLLSEFNFECVTHQKLNKIESYVGHDMYEKIFYPQQVLTWCSPICPVCGFRESVPSETQGETKKIGYGGKKNMLAILKNIPKSIWPKKTRYYWILGLYKRVDPK
jgi:ubiquinone/menaquinone biosynthesis C-methylase UbiE